MNQFQRMATPPEVNMKAIASVLKRRKGIITLCLVTSLAVTIAYFIFAPRKWQATGQIVLIQHAPPVATSPDTSFMAAMAPPEETPDSLLAMLQSDAMAKRTLDWLKNDVLTRNISRASLGIDDEEDFLYRFGRIVDSETPKDTNLILVSAMGHSPQAAIAISNAVCQAFVAWKTQLALENVKNLTADLETRVQKAKEAMEAAMRQEMAYKQNRHLVDLNTEQTTLLTNLAQREAEVDTNKELLASDNAKLKELGSQLKNVNTAIKNGEGVRDDSFVQSLQQQLNNLEMNRLSIQQLYTPDFPGMVANGTNPSIPSIAQLDNQIVDIKARLTNAIRNTITNKQPSIQSQGVTFDTFLQQQVVVMFDQSKLDASIKAVAAMKETASHFPKTSLDAMQLSNASDLARTQYANLLSELNTARYGMDMVQPDVQIAQSALVPTPGIPDSPNLAKCLAVGILLGIFLAVAYVLLLEQTDDRLYDIEKIKQLFKGPIVGALPPLRRRHLRQLIQNNGPAHAKEAFVIARANMDIVLGEGLDEFALQNRVILVTSTVPGEGKSITAAALAHSLAQAEKQVILVDADMRRPAQNMLFDTDEAKGLADILTGELTLDDGIVSTSIPNLAILHSGTAICNPSDLLSRPQLGTTIAALREQADVVIIDSPACSMVADALYLSRHVDFILHVVGIGQVPDYDFQDTTETLQTASRKPLLFFLNRLPRSRMRNSRSYYHITRNDMQNRSGMRANGSTPSNGTGTVLPSLPSVIEQQSKVGIQDDQTSKE